MDKSEILDENSEKGCLKLDGNVDGRTTSIDSIMGFHFDASTIESRDDRTGSPNGNHNTEMTWSAKYAFIQTQDSMTEVNQW